MDISKITPNLIQVLEQKHGEQLQALSRVLNVVAGKTLLQRAPTIARPCRERNPRPVERCHH